MDRQTGNTVSFTGISAPRCETQSNPIRTPRLGTAAPPSTAKQRWKTVKSKLLSYTAQQALSNPLGSALHFAHAAEILKNASKDPEQRGFYRSFMSFRERWAREMDEMGEGLSMLFSKTFAPYWTIFVLLFESTIFAFMAAEHSRLCLPQPGAEAAQDAPFGPENLLHFFNPNTPTTFLHTGYLYKWGGFFLPDSFGAGGYRWFTTALLHVSLAHCASNLIIYALLSAPFELRVGTMETAAVWITSAFGGTLAQAAIGNPCVVLVGASGTVYGSWGFFTADTVAYWHRSKRPYMRLTLVLTLIVLFSSQLQDQSVSHLAHAGGFYTGCSVGLMLRAQSRDARVSSPVLYGTAISLVLYTLVCVILTVKTYKGEARLCNAVAFPENWTYPTCSVPKLPPETE